jgi:hypothetical protein
MRNRWKGVGKGGHLVPTSNEYERARNRAERRLAQVERRKARKK